MQSVILKSYEGLVGQHYPTQKLILTSPNMSTIPDINVGPQNIRLRRQFHYGEHDPCLSPQPFDLRVPHLILLRFPGGGDNSTTIWWTVPSELEFEPIDGHKLSSEPLGFLPKHYVDTLKSMSDSLVPSDAKSTTDSKVKEYRSRIRYLFTRLSTPSTYPEALMVFRLIQRVCLELEAQIQWLSSVKEEFNKPHAWKTHALRSVVGALTDRLDIAEFCFRVSTVNFC